MKDIIKELNSDKVFLKIIDEFVKNNDVQEMKNYRQHYDTSCYEHCLVASYYSYKICKIFGWDYVAVARASMVHDLFLYDWRRRQDDRKGLHAFTHPKTAYENASKIFDLNKKEQDIIEKHMWPLTITKFPRYKESFVLSCVDKYCALRESFSSIFSKKPKK